MCGGDVWVCGCIHVHVLCVCACTCLHGHIPPPTGQVSQEQQLTALKAVQNLERQRQQVLFSLQQTELEIQQLQDAHEMEQQFQEAMKVQQIVQPEVSGQPIKLALRKRCVYSTLYV